MNTALDGVFSNTIDQGSVKVYIKEKTKPDRKESKSQVKVILSFLVNRKRKYNEIESDEEGEEEYKSK